MRLLICSTLLALCCLAGYSQNNTQHIMKIALKDKSNFTVMNALGGTIPSTLYVLETTKKWSTLHFVIDSVDLDDPQVKMQMDSGTYAPYNRRYRNTYANPYFQTYLFRDTMLAKKIDKAERLKLKQVALKRTTATINLVGPGYFTLSKERYVDKGYFMVMSTPIFTSDNKYAFIHFDIYLKEQHHYNDPFKQHSGGAYFGNVLIVYEEQQDGSWLRIAKKDHHIL